MWYWVMLLWFVFFRLSSDQEGQGRVIVPDAESRNGNDTIPITDLLSGTLLFTVSCFVEREGMYSLHFLRYNILSIGAWDANTRPLCHHSQVVGSSFFLLIISLERKQTLVFTCQFDITRLCTVVWRYFEKIWCVVLLMTSTQCGVRVLSVFFPHLRSLDLLWLMKVRENALRKLTESN